MLRLYNVENGELRETGKSPADVRVYVSPDEFERRQLIDGYKVDEHTLLSSLDPDELSRLEFEPDHVAIIFKRPCNQTITDGDDAHLEFKVASVGAFLYGDKLIAIQSQDMPIYPGVKPVNRAFSLREVLLRMLFRTITHFLEHIRAMNMMVDAIEREINRSFENRHLISLFALEKSLVYYLNAINSNDTLLLKMRNNAAKIGFSAEEMEMLDDIIIENNQCGRQAQIYTNILAGMMDARASIVSNNLNVLMKTLTMITICLQVPTMVVSIFSMNVALPISYDHPLSFWFVISLSVLALMAFMMLWRWRRW
ncbi:MAG: magnesium transporter CorA family protein [Planctomycetota bacterium]|jgi:magnesium transporter|nr:magnesium transporter CorA family protein [Planctomycetota bacterium]